MTCDLVCKMDLLFPLGINGHALPRTPSSPFPPSPRKHPPASGTIPFLPFLRPLAFDRLLWWLDYILNSPAPGPRNARARGASSATSVTSAVTSLAMPTPESRRASPDRQSWTSPNSRRPAWRPSSSRRPNSSSSSRLPGRCPLPRSRAAAGRGSRPCRLATTSSGRGPRSGTLCDGHHRRGCLETRWAAGT